MNAMSTNAPAHPAGTNTLSHRRHRHDHARSNGPVFSIPPELSSQGRVTVVLSIVFWDWLRDSESGSRTKRIVGIVFGGLVAARHLRARDSAKSK